MEKIVLLTDMGKRVIVNTEENEKVYSSPVRQPNTGTIYKSGTDLYRHVTEKGTVVYYLHHWSPREDIYELIPRARGNTFSSRKT